MLASGRKGASGLKEAYIVEAVRTPIGRGREDGALHSVQPVDLLAMVLNEVVARAGLQKADVEDVIAGCVTPVGEQGGNIGRLALLKSGFPTAVPGFQLNRACGSSQQAVHSSAQAIAAGDIDLGISCGVEMMGRVEMGSDFKLGEAWEATFPFTLVHQGISAEMIARKWDLRRTELDAYSAESHRKAAAATEAGWYRREILPVTVGQNGNGVVDRDEGIRFSVDPDRMAALPPVFQENGVITAGNSSQVSDGAAALLLASGSRADALGLRKRARIVGRVVVGSDPEFALTGPIPATRAILKKTGLGIEDMDAIEINEAFASVVLAWVREIAPPMDRVNIQGGAISHGHPLGATGAVLMTKLLHILERTGGRYGLQTMCIGFGMATATIIERMEAA